MSQSSIKIVYPVEGGTYPVAESDGLVSSAYVTVSFSMTSAGGPHKIKWGFDSVPIGGTTFYDQCSTQFTWNLSAGEHTFHVVADDGSKAEVRFEVA
ncbi:MAG: hypothetical protein D3925_17575 [Candidatus Electrothrix sp. AR5]|nr:hypothetical protein [Candidatus Electrothrix sp. AR5]